MFIKLLQKIQLSVMPIEVSLSKIAPRSNCLLQFSDEFQTEIVWCLVFAADMPSVGFFFLEGQEEIRGDGFV